MKIYQLLAKASTLEADRGDKINEKKFGSALNIFADVYYNNVPIKELDHDSHKEDKISPPNQSYDLHYVRNNKEIFCGIKGKKVAMGYPYDEDVFSAADAIIVTTEEWKNALENYNSSSQNITRLSNYYPKKIVQPKSVINIKQIIDPTFAERITPFQTFRYKAKFGYGFTIAYFGRVDPEAQFHSNILSAIPVLKNKIKNLNVVFAGKIRSERPAPEIIIANSIPYEDMPNALAASDIVLCNEHDEANWLGSGKTLEAMLLGKPIVLKPRPARVEQLGKDYPLYYETQSQFEKLILKLYQDKQFYNDVTLYMQKRAKLFFPEVRAKAALSEFKTLIKES